MVKSTKNRGIWFGILRALLFAIFLFLLIVQVRKSEFSLQEIRIHHYWSLVVLILLVPINWGIEYMKWLRVLRFSEVQCKPNVKKSSFYAGMVTGMLTPNMLGNFLGRMYYFQRRDRISVTILTLISSYSQFLVSFIFGAAALFALGKTPFGPIQDIYLLLIILLLVLSVLIFLFFDRWIRWILPRYARLALRVKNVQQVGRFTGSILFLSVVRHIVFTLQMLLAMLAFGAEWSSDLLWWIWQYYFWLILAPSLFLGKFIVRDSVAMWVLGAAGFGSVVILGSSLFIWLVNLLLPTLLALFLVRQKS